MFVIAAFMLALYGVLTRLASRTDTAMTSFFYTGVAGAAGADHRNLHQLGLLPDGIALMDDRPVRTPHHSATAQALIGGGTIPRPGEVSLSHNGILFLDEATSALDVHKERAVRACENIYAVGDSVGMCRFTTKLFNSPTLPGLEEFRDQLANVTGLAFSTSELEQCGLNIMGVERLINHRLGVRRKDDTLPDRWFDEPNPAGPYKGEKIDRQEFDAMLTRFYEISRLTSEGVPDDAFKKELTGALGIDKPEGLSRQAV